MHGTSLMKWNNIQPECYTFCTDQMIHPKLITFLNLSIHHLPTVKIFQFDMNCVMVPVRPFHEVSLTPILFQCSIYSLQKPNNRQSLFELHWQNLQIGPPKSSKYSVLSKSNHTKIQELHINLTVSFIFEHDFFLIMGVNFEEACIFVKIFDQL